MCKHHRTLYRSGLSLCLLSLLAAGTQHAQTSVQIHDIMTNLPNSPYLGQSVSAFGRCSHRYAHRYQLFHRRSHPHRKSLRDRPAHHRHVPSCNRNVRQHHRREHLRRPGLRLDEHQQHRPHPRKGTTTGDFTVSATTCTGAVAANATCTVAVVFTPSALGARTGTVTVASSSSANPTLTATLSGRGVADVEANASLLNFGNVDLGSTSAAQTLTITNYTSTSIALTSLTLAGDYADINTCGSTLGGLSNCTVAVTFHPTALGVRAGSLTINTSDTKYPVITVALTGNGVDFLIALAPSSGSTIAGDGTVASVATLTPLGGFNAAISLACTTNASASICPPATAGLSLTAVTTDTLTIATTSQYTVVGYGLHGTHGRMMWLCLLLTLLSTTGVSFARSRVVSWGRLLLVLAALGTLTLGATGCSGKLPSTNAPYTAAGSYTYTVSVTDGILTHSATYTLTVQAK